MGTKYTGSIEIGGTSYRWNVKRAARTSYDGLTGVSLYVFVDGGDGRDLILDFRTANLVTPSRQKTTPQSLSRYENAYR